MPSLSEYSGLLPDGTVDAWPRVAAVLPEDSALMGGTGLAIWLRHRPSQDLDIFVPALLDPVRLLPALSAAGDFVVLDASERLIRGVFNSVNVDIVAEEGAHRLGPPLDVDGLRVASLQDITAGKFRAVTGRKQLRDLVDVMCIETHGGIDVEHAIMLYFRRYSLNLDYAGVNGVLGHLVDFRHLEDDPAMAAAFGDDIRDRVEEFFRSRQTQIAEAFQQLLAEDV